MPRSLPPFPELVPDLLEEWNYEKNEGVDPHALSAGSQIKVWWVCKQGHEWPAALANRARQGKGCPHCAGQLVDKKDSFAYQHPKLLKEWHPVKNEGLDPYAVTPGSGRRVWWKCEYNHEWDATITVRVKNETGCPTCNSLGVKFPEIAKEWHPTKNGDLTPFKVSHKSGKRIWWKCKECLNEWLTNVKNRTHLNSPCPICSKDMAVIKYKQNIAEKIGDDILPNYSYDAEDKLFLDYNEMQNIFKYHLKIESLTRSVDSLFSPRSLNKIDYEPYYQRKYVWDKQKATYFIESILIGTEVPPLIFYEFDGSYEVIDGRQRFETLKRFISDELSLSNKGLYTLKFLDKMVFSDLDQTYRENLFDTKIRIVKFTVVDESRFDIKLQDMLKKEIFRRYNSGITPLRRAEIEKAIYINDGPTQYFKKQFKRNTYIYTAILSLFFTPKDLETADKPYTLEKALQEVRFLLVAAEMPIMSTRVKDTFEQFYSHYSENLEDVYGAYRNFLGKMKFLLKVQEEFESNGRELNRYCYEALYWALSVLERENIPLEKFTSERIMPELLKFFEDESSVFFASDDDQFFYKYFFDRYQVMANFLEKKYGLSLGEYLRHRRGSSKAQSTEDQSNGASDIHENFLHIEKTEAIPYAIDDICRMMHRGRFVVRPVYQRSEVINKKKSSAVIESIILGIKLPPLYIFRRDDDVLEVIDGQQRLLSILAFMGQKFIDESGKWTVSNKNEFSLSNLQILEDLNKKNFEELEESIKEKIYDFPISLIIIDQKFNKGFDPVDLYIRLNNRPYPIKENTFEMWNSYVDKEIVDEIKRVSTRHEGWFFLGKNNVRMRNEELLTMLSYFEYVNSIDNKEKNKKYTYLDIFQKETTINIRIKQKSNVTKILNKATVDKDEKHKFLNSIKMVESFLRNLRTILIDRDCTDESKFLELELNSIFNVHKKKYYSRKFQDFYGLWFIVHSLNQEMIIKNRSKIKKEVTELILHMKSDLEGQKGAVEKSEFIALAESFRTKYTTASRRITLTADEKRALINSQNNICPLCQGAIYVNDDVEVDHIEPLATGGKDRFLNLQLTHKICNRKKGAR